MLASCAFDVKFHSWEEWKSFASVSAPDPKSKSFLDITWSNDGKHLVAVPSSGKSFVITPTYVAPLSPGSDLRREPVTELIDISHATSATYSKEILGQMIVGTDGGQLIIYNSKSKRVSRNFGDLPGTVNMVECGAQDSFVAAGCDNGQIFVFGDGYKMESSYYVPGSEQLTKITVHGTIPHLLAAGSEKGIVAIWDIFSGNNIFRSMKHKGSVMDIAFSATDDTFTTIGADRTINIYDLRTADCVHEKQFETGLTSLAYCPNGMDLTVGTCHGQIICVDKRQLHSTKVRLKAHHSPIKKLTFQECNEKLLVDKESDGAEDEWIALSDAVKVKSPIGELSLSKTTILPSLGINQNFESFHIINNNCFEKLKEEVSQETRHIVENLTTEMNERFMKMRMSIFREFCKIENLNKKKLEEFNQSLTKISDEDQRVPSFGSVHSGPASDKGGPSHNSSSKT